MRKTATLIATALAMALAGCTSNGGGDTGGGDSLIGDPNKLHFKAGKRPSQHLELDDFDFEWEDIEKNSAGEPSPYEVAQWVKHRSDAALLCLRASPPDYEQARALMNVVVRNVPTATRVRALLAQTEFSDSAYWYQVADRCSWEVARIEFEKTDSPGPQGNKLTDEEVKELIDSFQPYLQKANEMIRTHSQSALRHFDVYRQARPDDRAVADSVWKLYFRLQDYEKAKQWLDYVLREMDLNEVPEEEPIRQDYMLIRRSIVEYLAVIKLEGHQQRQGSGLFPFSNQRSRSARDRLREGFTPGD